MTESSLEVGFRSLGSFSTAFRALAGEAPSRYRASWRERAEPAVPGCHTLVGRGPPSEHFSRSSPVPRGDSVAA